MMCDEKSQYTSCLYEELMMKTPSDIDVRRFYRIAVERFNDCQFLYENKRNTAAVYLAGYSVECMLKSLLINVTPKRKRKEMVKSFHGAFGHNYEQLRVLYSKRGGAQIPADIARCLTRVNSWSVTMRYEPGKTKDEDADSFVNAVKKIIQWANGRLK